jgi:predicted RNA-binding protein with PUA-like domain
MNYWLLKSEPQTYSWDDLVKDKKTVWDGISNPVALRNIRSMKKGDLAFIYHTGDERAAVGIAQIASDPRPDPKADNDRSAVVDLKPDKKLPHPVSLAQIKSDPTFAGWDLLRIGRLSVVPVPPKMWQRILDLAEGKS